MKEPLFSFLDKLEEKAPVPPPTTEIVSVSGRKEYFDTDNRHHRINGPAIIHPDGTTEWWFHGARHRADGPAIEYANGDKEWFVNGLRHRDGAAAFTSTDGNEAWYFKGTKHRENGPAMSFKNGSKKWFVNGKMHREDGPASITKAVAGDHYFNEWWINGEQFDGHDFKIWQNNLQYLKTDQPKIGVQIDHFFSNDQGKLHRENGPARVWKDDTKEWFIDGQRHRSDGPAIEFSNGEVLFYINGRSISKSEFETRNKSLIEKSSQASTVVQDKTEEKKAEEKKIKQWPDDPEEMVLYQDIYVPMKQILEDAYNLKRNLEWKFNYSGYDIGKLEKQITPHMKEQFSEKRLRWEKEKNNLSVMDVVMRSIFLMGIEQGRRMSYKEQLTVKTLQKTLSQYRERNKSIRYQLARSQAILKIREENPTKSYDQLVPLINVELEKTRSSRIEEIKKEMRLDPSISCFKKKAKKKTKLSDLLAMANTLDTEVFKFSDWVSVLQEANCSVDDWKSYCRKNKFNKFTGK